MVNYKGREVFTTTDELLIEIIILLESLKKAIEFEQKELPKYDEMKIQELKDLVRTRIKNRPKGWGIMKKEQLIEILERGE